MYYSGLVQDLVRLNCCTRVIVWRELDLAGYGRVSSPSRLIFPLTGVGDLDRLREEKERERDLDLTQEGLLLLGLLVIVALPKERVRSCDKARKLS